MSFRNCRCFQRYLIHTKLTHPLPFAEQRVPPAVCPSRSSRTKDRSLSNFPTPAIRIGTELSPRRSETQLAYRLMGETAQPLDRLTAPDAMSRHRGCQTFPVDVDSWREDKPLSPGELYPLSDGPSMR